jgi:heme a synthase
MISGAFVVGNDAGRAYNTFAKMNAEWIPSHLYNELQPYYRNIYENTATVQFHHRLLRITTACTGLYLSLRGYITPLLLSPQVRKGFIAIGVTSVGQALLGITTLLTCVPIPLAALHQIGSIIVLTSGIYLVHLMKYMTKRIIPKYATNTPAAATASFMATSSTTAHMVGKHTP